MIFGHFYGGFCWFMLVSAGFCWSLVGIGESMVSVGLVPPGGSYGGFSWISRWFLAISVGFGEFLAAPGSFFGSFYGGVCCSFAVSDSVSGGLF